MNREYSMLETEVGGLDYRTVAMVMTAGGDQMGHSTVRNIIVRVMEKFAYVLMAHYGVTGDPFELACNPKFQRLMALTLQEMAIEGPNAVHLTEKLNGHVSMARST